MRKLLIAVVAAVLAAPLFAIAAPTRVAHADICSAQAAANPGAGPLCRYAACLDGTGPCQGVQGAAPATAPQPAAGH